VELYPVISLDFWEKEFIMNKNPKLYSRWKADMAKPAGIK